MREVEVLAGAGYKEIVLTGVHLGSYGRDLEPRSSLARLICGLASIESLSRLRLSSIEPTDLGDDMIDLISDPAAKVCPHVHVPLQSGDDRILGLMGRPYGRSFYRDLILRIAEGVPRCGIGADVMVGFPSEDLAAFRSTYDLIDELPVTYLHAFAFSARESTAAAGLAAQVDPAAKKERSSLVRALGKAKAEAFRASLVGTAVEVLVLATRSAGRPVGLSGNYVKVLLDDEAAPNTLVSALVTKAVSGGLLARRSGTPKSDPDA
jgi:threonylcarbamoyladenosine tRNA methylthiotransferase MtaB